jgi:hypothetical protein
MSYKTKVSIATALTWLLLATSSAIAQTWSQLVTAGPPPATGYGVQVNYDAANSRLIAFLARLDMLASDEVWVLTNANGLGGTATWTQLQPTGNAPTINWGATAVYDAWTNQLIVYGGCSGDCGSVLPGVYVLTHANGLGGTPAWSPSSTNSPEARALQSVVYNPANKRMVAFGGELGFFGTSQNDTRVLLAADRSSSTWNTLATSRGPPGVRDAQSAVYDRLYNVMTTFGGEDLISTCCPYSISEYNDVWTLSNADGSGSGTPTWTQLSPTGTPPPPRANHSAVSDPERNVMYVFGGSQYSDSTQSAIILGDLWKLSNSNGLGSAMPKWTQIGQRGTPPGGNSSHGAAFDRVNQRMIVFGGTDRNSKAHNLTFILDLLQH